MNYNPYGNYNLWENHESSGNGAAGANVTTQQSNANNTQAANNEEFDSDQLDEDESYSWASGITDQGESCTANWRGWRTTPSATAHHHVNLIRRNSLENHNSSLPKLVDICAKFIAMHMPFELVETFPQPVPEDLQLKITFSSFPDSAEDIRLYSCLANGTSDEYQKGEQLYLARNVVNCLQIGFHLSASVASTMQHQQQQQQQAGANGNNLAVSKNAMQFNVAVVCDRKKITSCHCTCSKANSWCSHIVAVCLYRIYESKSVELRAPVSESLSKLQRDQLQKFAQYLISELPQQILPTAQKLLDELLKGSDTSINITSGAPDPTAGSSASDLSVWCLDEHQLQENIRRTLSKFVTPTPHVVSDVDYLANPSSAASNEFTSLLRPLRGREPEGMWNLISIVREMLRKRDANAIPLLKMITSECVSLDQVLYLWFLIKVSPLYNDLHRISHTTGNHGNHRNNTSSHNHQSPPVHQACAVLLDEIVSLWRIACLNPRHNPAENLSYKDTLVTWQRHSFEKLRKFLNLNTDKFNLLTRLDAEHFHAFQPAIDSCEITWSSFDFTNLTQFRNQCKTSLPTSTTSPPTPIATQPQATALTEPLENSTEAHQTSSDYDLYQFEFDKSLINSRSNREPKLNYLSKNRRENALEVLFNRCECLYAHGYSDHAIILAEILAEFLQSPAHIESIYDECAVSVSNSSNGRTTTTPYRLLTSFQSTILWRSALITQVLLDCTHPNYHLAFSIAIFGLEMPRLPAASKAMEVKLFNQEADLLTLLKRIPIGKDELNLLRQKAEKMKAGELRRCRGDGLLPLQLAAFIFETFLPHADLEPIGFDAAVTCLGLKTSLNEAQFSILCEGIRRQRGDLALAMLLTFKDDQSRLMRIMDKILDRDVHALFRAPTNPFAPNLKKLQSMARQPDIENSKITNSHVSITQQVSGGEARSSVVATSESRKYSAASALDSLSSGWEESENEQAPSRDLLEAKFKCMSMATKSGNSGSKKAASSLESETTSSDNSPTLTRKSQKTPINNDAATLVASASAATVENLSVKPWADGTFTESPDNDNIPQQQQQLQQQQQQPSVPNNQRNFNQMLNNMLSMNSNKKGAKITRNQRMPTEALAHFMFDFSKTLLAKAGGTVSTSVYSMTHHNAMNGPPHRNLHICAFLVALYALGLQNCVQVNWLSRTYSSQVSWINGQAAEIGYPAICILIECWQGHLTPSECALLADRTSRGRDTAAVRAASELALSSLKYAHMLNLQEIQRALLQCKEQSDEMLQRACLTVEAAVCRDECNNVAGNTNVADVLFEVARKWDDLYLDSAKRSASVSQPDSSSSGIGTQSTTSTISEIVSEAPSAMPFNPYAQSVPPPQPQFTFVPYPPSPFVPQNVFIPAMYTPYGTLVAPNAMGVFGGPQGPIMYQMAMGQSQQQQQQQQQQLSQVQKSCSSIDPVDSEAMKYLQAAFRVGMIALEAMQRRVDSSHQIKYLRNPPYGDNVKWLWGVSIKLGTASLQQFCQSAANVIQNPFLIQELAFDTANHLCRNNPTQFANTLRAPMLNILVQKCLSSYFRSCMQKVHHINPNEHEDFISMVVTARNAFYFSGNINCFNDLLQNLRKSKSCKKELWTRLCNALANTNTSSYP